MKNTIVLYTIILIAVLLAVFMWRSDGNKSTVPVDDRDFAVQDINEIDRIFIASRTGESVQLSREADSWLVNDRYPAKSNAIENLLGAIEKVEIKYIPSQAAVKNIVKTMAAHGIKVEIYNRSGSMIRSYYIGGSTHDETGNYYIMENADQPYVVHVPIWTGSLRPRFELSVDEWRDKSIFSEDIQNIKRVSVVYPRQKYQSFEIRAEGREFHVLPYFEDYPRSMKPYRDGSAEKYLLGFDRLGSESFKNDYIYKHSILRLEPFSHIEVETVDGRIETADFFPRTDEEIDGPDYDGFDREFIFRYFVHTGREDFMTAQHLVVEKVFWGYDSFFED